MRTRFLNLRVPTGGDRTDVREIVVERGRFAEILPSDHETAVGGEQWVNLEGALVLPGVIDSTVHLGDPGYTHREDFSSGTCAAAAGGVTCVVDGSSASLPAVTSIAALRAKLRAIGAKAHVDYMLWGGVSAASLAAGNWRDELTALVEGGVAAIDVDPSADGDGRPDIGQSELRDILLEARRLAVPVGIHCERGAVLRQLTERMMQRAGGTAADYAESRPQGIEVAAVAGAVEACRAIGVRVHVLHLTSAEALGLISAGRLEGLPLSAGTCPHFLEFTRDDLEREGSLLKTDPVVKSNEDRWRLWEGLGSGELSIVASDHSPGQWPEEQRTGSIWTDHSGLPGVELLLPYLYSEGVCTGRISLERLVAITAAEPARLLGISHRKGRIRRGLDADFVVIDEHETWTVHPERLHSLNRYTPLAGRRITGRVRAAYVRGQCVYQRHPDGSEFFAPPGTGAYLPRGVG